LRKQGGTQKRGDGPEARGASRTSVFSRPSSLAPRRSLGVGAIVFGSDQGLVGQFNDVLADFAAQALNALPGEKKVWAVGERIHARLQDAGLIPLGLFAVPTSVNAITPLVGQILLESEAHHDQAEFGQLYLYHNSPRSGAAYEPVGQRLLPLDAPWGLRLAHLPWPTKNLPDVIGGQEETLSALVREYFFVSLFKACAESLASENASRLAAMQRAEKNIDELVLTLNQTFRRLRQTSIDEELFEVLAGASDRLGICLSSVNRRL
jgi:F-type H+-transporting ATPase subunit gamma